jgi:acyl-CoA thioesterase-1
VSFDRNPCVRLASFARYWLAHNDRVLARDDGPLWVVLGDSTAQGLGASSPDGGYVGQVLAELRQETGLPWRVLNLSVSGSLARDVLGAQLPLMLPAELHHDHRTLACVRKRPAYAT